MGMWIDDIMDTLKKAPEITKALLSEQLDHHKEQLLLMLDAVPMETYAYHMSLLRQLMKKIEELESRVNAYEHTK